MIWQTEVKNICKQYDIDPVMIDDELVLICPKMPDKDVQKKLTEVIPSTTPYKFQEGPRLSTSTALKILFQTAGAASADSEIKGHDIVITITGQTPPLIEEESPVWGIAAGILKVDPFIDSWKIKINDKVVSEYNKTVATMIANQKRPERVTSFSNDDILNLQITLENCQDVNDFINAL
jgi:hypothetical protein